MSAASARPRPAPTQTPSTFATTGIGQSCTASTTSPSTRIAYTLFGGSAGASPSPGALSRVPLRSAPAREVAARTREDRDAAPEYAISRNAAPIATHMSRSARRSARSRTRVRASSILTGAGGNFCAGADLSGTRDSGPGDGTRRRSPPNNVYAMRVLADVVLAIHDCPVPVVAKVDGLCVGAGLGLALAADLTWCSDRSRFSAIFAKRGLSLDFGTSWLLRQRIGVHKAKELAFTAKMFSGAEAFELGLVNAVGARPPSSTTPSARSSRRSRPVRRSRWR